MAGGGSRWPASRPPNAGTTAAFQHHGAPHVSDSVAGRHCRITTPTLRSSAKRFPETKPLAGARTRASVARILPVAVITRSPLGDREVPSLTGSYQPLLLVRA